MIPNYFVDDTQSTPVNTAAARILLCSFILWKLVRYEWVEYPQWPDPIQNILPLFRHPLIFVHVEWIALLCGLLVASVLIGYRIQATAWMSAVLLTYLGTVRHSFQHSHTSRILFTAAIILLLFAVFSDEHYLSVDQIRRTRYWELESLTNHLETKSGRFQHRAMKWALVVIGFFYFHTGFSKIVFGNPIAWIQPANLGRYILFRSNYGSTQFIGEFLLQYPILLSVGAVVTIALEIGFLLAVVFKRPLWPFFTGVVGMHIAIMFSVGPVFTDQILLLALFLPWEKGLMYLQRTDELVIVYDRHCFFCARSLHLFKYLDGSDLISYYNQYNVPEKWDGANFEEAMYAFRDGESYRGYYAFAELLQQLGIRPVYFMMGLPVVRNVGEAVYQYIAKNRSRYFVCSTENEG